VWDALLPTLLLLRVLLLVPLPVLWSASMEPGLLLLLQVLLLMLLLGSACLGPGLQLVGRAPCAPQLKMPHPLLLLRLALVMRCAMGLLMVAPGRLALLHPPLQLPLHLFLQLPQQLPLQLLLQLPIQQQLSLVPAMLSPLAPLAAAAGAHKGSPGQLLPALLLLGGALGVPGRPGQEHTAP
jgi:hypothetical protein